MTELSGKTIAHIENSNEINFSNFANGLYILSIEDESGKVSTHKISKK
ncbi:T9SS type A sorting domain-containing protein [Flavobacterium gelidilacus]